MTNAAPEEQRVIYERPTLVSVGNLHDLLLGASGLLCDALIANPACGNPESTGGACEPICH
jgi:hypothetical protein